MAPVRRPRAIGKADHAACPFGVTSITRPSYHQGNDPSKKRKRGNANGGKVLTQEWPHGPSLDLRVRKMDVSYSVRPWKKWLDMTRYNSFVLNGIKYCKEDFVYVANDATVDQQNTSKDDPDPTNMIQLTDHWVARILEIRAADEHHVYARVYWMYSPVELPPNTVINRQLVSEQLTRYGQNELIASNHMDIINVVSVVKRAIVHQPVDLENVQDEGAVYWRQVFDCRNSELSWMNERDESKPPNLSEASTVVDTKEERTHAVLPTNLSGGKTEKSQSPSEAQIIKFDHTGARLDADTNRPAEIPCRTIEDTGTSIAKNLAARSHLVETDTNGDCSGSTQMLAAEQPVPQVESVGPVTLDVMSRGSHPPFSGCAHSPRTPSTSTGLPSTAMIMRALGALGEGPSVSPVYLPSKSQHVLLTHLQSILEISCYELAKRIMPDIIQRRGWDCAESLELNRWIDEFQRRQKCFSPAALAGKPLKTLFRSVANIRHCAVHRRKVSVKCMEQFLLDAEAFAMLFGDTERGEHISTLRQDMQITIKELDRSRILFYARLGENLGLRGNKKAHLHQVEGFE